MTDTPPAPADPFRAAAERVAAAVLAVDGVHALGRPLERAAGALQQAGVAGVRLTGLERAAIAVVAGWPVDVQDLARRVRAAVVPLLEAGARVDVEIVDVHGPFDPDDDAVEASEADAGAADVPTASDVAPVTAGPVAVGAAAPPATPPAALEAAPELPALPATAHEDAAPAPSTPSGTDGAASAVRAAGRGGARS